MLCISQSNLEICLHAVDQLYCMTVDAESVIWSLPCSYVSWQIWELYVWNGDTIQRKDSVQSHDVCESRVTLPQLTNKLFIYTHINKQLLIFIWNLHVIDIFPAFTFASHIIWQKTHGPKTLFRKLSSLLFHTLMAESNRKSYSKMTWFESPEFFSMCARRYGRHGSLYSKTSTTTMFAIQILLLRTVTAVIKNTCTWSTYCRLLHLHDCQLV